jgi:hypothetical protein
MAIIGLTVSETGEPIQRLAVATKVSIGEVKRAQSGKTYPSKLDHFAFLRKGKELGWETDPELTEHYGKECREFWVFFMSDDLESVFRTGLAWWTATERKCWGDGQTATRRTDKHPEGEDWKPCGEECHEFNSPCKPSGDLYFRLVDFPRIGATCRTHTSGKQSVVQISSALMELRGMTGGRLMGVKAKLVVRPEKTSYFDEKEKKKKSTVIYALNLELDRKENMEQLIGSMTEYSRLFERTQKLLGPGRVLIEDEPERERAADIAPEFYPVEEIAAAPTVQQPSRTSESKTITLEGGKPATTVAPEKIWPKQGDNNGNGHAAPTAATITKEQRQRLYAIVNEHGYSNTQVKAILEELWGLKSSTDIGVDKFDEIVKYFESDGQVKPAYQATDDDVPW